MKEKEHENHTEIDMEISLEQQGLEKNIEFAQKLWGNKEQNSSWTEIFDMRSESSITRENDPGMNFEKFIPLINEMSYCNCDFKLSLNGNLGIRYLAAIREGRVKHFAWLECEYNKNNFDIISSIYKEVFEKDITTEGKFHGIENYFTLQNVPMPK